MSDVNSIELSVLVPARNEADCLRECLGSLVGQSGDGFLLGKNLSDKANTHPNGDGRTDADGRADADDNANVNPNGESGGRVDWELIVVNDGSTDGTRGIAESFDGVTVMDAPELPSGWTGKNHALWVAAQASRGRWLLFTDADTVHEPGDLIRAMGEAKKYGAAMLSYSPRQMVSGVAQRLVMPLVFSELAAVYKPKDVSDPAKRMAAANGQFILIEREAYFSAGGHKAVADRVLEDVALAWNVKRSKSVDAEGNISKVGRVVRFRYAPDAVSARMYRSFGQMVEGWTKNLALLFPQPLALAAWRLLDLALLVGLPVLAAWLWVSPMMLIWWAPVVIAVLWVRTLARVYMRIAKSHFGWMDCLMAPVGIPIFSWLLWRSWTRHTFGKRVGWKGRTYPVK